MTLQTSGSISLLDIAYEFNDTAPHSLSEFYGVATGVPTSGEITLADFYGVSSSFYPHQIDQSLRFNDDDSAYLSRTPSSTGNRRQFTISFWVKRANINVGGKFYQQRLNSNSSQQFSISWLNNENIRIIDQNSSGVSKLIMDTTAVFRDPSSWYHIVVAVDTTLSTAADRCKLWVNGEQVTDVTTAVQYTQNYDTSVNTTDRILIGCQRPNSSSTLNSFSDDYFAEYHLIDGTALDASSFGQTKTGVWIPKAYSGSYGTNGFYLDFGGTYYNDKSGNGNNFTANNLAATDVVLDSPTNNFCTQNSAHRGRNGYVILSEGNLKYTGSGSGWDVSMSTMSVNSGKWYAEFCRTNSTQEVFCGIHQSNGALLDNIIGYNTNTGYGYSSNSGNKYHLDYGTSYGASWTTGDVIGVALDMDAGTLTFYKNGVSQGTAFTGLSGDFVMATSGVSGSEIISNYGQDSSFAGNKTAQGNTDDNGYGDFYYAPPTGYLALCTANLTLDAAMDPINGNSPQDYFNTVLYTGNNSTQAITGVGFQPDWTWIKARNTSSMGHILTDNVRGVGKAVFSNNTNAEDTNHAYGYLSVFGTDGFTVTAGSTNADRVNNSSYNYAAWNWKAGGTGVSNTDGSITSTVSANTDAGFSIVTWTGNGTQGATIGHGLGAVPKCFITFRRDASGYQHAVYHVGIGATKYLDLAATSAAQTNTWWDDTTPTSSVISLGLSGRVNGSGGTYVGYAFSEIEGFSKFGSYTGNGSTDGTFVYTGFRPAYLLTKRVDSAGGWHVFDSVRGNYNPNDPYLYPHLSNAEYGGVDTYDLLSNGFKNTRAGVDQNASGGTYIYMAFAENPFKYANAR